MSANIRIAILDDHISAQFSERPAEAQGLEIAWRGTDYDELVRFTGKEPVSLAMLKTQMMGTIVRSLLGTTRAPAASPPVAVRRNRDVTPIAPAYTDAQLGLLRERKSSLACECPNHVAELVSSLVAFERYSRACANRDDDDANMHRALASATAQARRTMEAALTELLHFEKIEV